MEQVSKRVVLQAYLAARRRMRYGCTEHWRERRVIALLKKVLPLSEHYREKYEGLKVKDWREFPMIDKAEMMANFDSLNTVGVRLEEALTIARAAEQSRDFSSQLGDISVGLSSGTSGNAGVFLANPKERAVWAGNILAKVLPQSLLHSERIALFLRANNRLYESTNSKRVSFEFFDLLEPIEAHVERWETFKPGVVVAPPSMWLLLAGQREAGLLRHVPAKIISAAESLDRLDAARVESAFGRRLHEIYQCTEGFLATTCSHGTLHVNEDVVFIQKDYIDQSSGRFAPVITDFCRTSQPIIRYRLDDILVERRGEPCPCGSSWMAIEQIEGRCDDLCFIPDRDPTRPEIPVFPDFLRRAIIGADAAISDYRIRQVEALKFEVSFDVESASKRSQIEKSIVDGVNARLHTLGGRDAAFEFVPIPSRDALQKRRRVLRDCPLPEGLL